MIDDITGNQVGFSCTGRLYNRSDPVCFESFLDGPVSRFIMRKEFNMFSRFQTSQIAIIRNSQSMQFKGKCLRQITAMSQDTELLQPHISPIRCISVYSLSTSGKPTGSLFHTSFTMKVTESSLKPTSKLPDSSVTK